MMNIRLLILLLSSLSLLGGCASNVPKAINTAPEQDISLTQARAAIETYQGAVVRWGGTIAGVENRAEQTLIAIVARPLESGGRPFDTDQSPGRFLARFQGFLDPAIFAEERQLTVRGTLVGEETGAIGEYEYRFPVVDVEVYYLWEPQVIERCINCEPWYYDPWYPYPRYPYTPYPRYYPYTPPPHP